MPKSLSTRQILNVVLRLLILVGLPVLGPHARGQEQEETLPVEPVVAAASAEATTAMETMRVPDGFRASLFAAEPDVANIVAFTIDDQGRVFVCESFRQSQGVTDNRSHNRDWTDRDLAAQTVADRIAYHRELLPNQGRDYERQDDRIRLLLDDDHDGHVDRSVVFANHFNQIEDGTGAGVLVVGNSVLFTCIPHLWSLEDRDGDGIADVRESLQDGFGVRVAFRGHDMHGLIRGPDGRIYFSIGDRGYHLETREGKTFANPETGAIFRCMPDGSRLEVIATGLRNPQELAFDAFGNLFTGDNNSDSGDRARWVYVLPGADSGWRMSYQYLPDRGPFNRERLWHPFHDEQPAFIMPPVDNLGDGPSGVAYYPGTGFGSGFADHFFMCDFRGGSAMSGIRAFRMRPKGAFYELDDSTEPIWQVLATDLAFGPEGAMYVSDWVNGWVGEGKGRIYRIIADDHVQSAEVLDTQARLRAVVDEIESRELATWLGHPDQRVRLKAQWELARRQEISLFADAATASEPLLHRIHGIWGLWQCTVENGGILDADSWKVFATCLRDEQPEIRAQAVRVLGDLNWDTVDANLRSMHRAAICEALDDAEPRVRMLAALALRNIGVEGRESVAALVQLLRDNDNRDPAIRHAAVMGLTSMDDESIAALALNDPAVSVRRAGVVALRKKNSSRVIPFLSDSNSLVAEEAARAIYDLPIPEGMNDLAAQLGRLPGAVELDRRALYANVRVGTEDAARRMITFALGPAGDPSLRATAVRLLGEWNQPKTRDEIIGMWRPIDARPFEIARTILEQHFPELCTADREVEIRRAALVGLANLGCNSDGVRETLAALVADDDSPVPLRETALASMGKLFRDQAAELAMDVRKSEHAEIRTAAREILLRVNPDVVLDDLIESLDSEDMDERRASLGLLVGVDHPRAAVTIEAQLKRLSEGTMHPDLRLDVRLAARNMRRKNKEIARQLDEYEAQLKNAATPSARYADSLRGGNGERGRELFYHREQLSCLRCHRIGLDGGNVGPNLSDVGLKRTREFLLQSIVEPNAQITEKFGTVVLLDDSGKTVSGILHMENDDVIRLINSDGEFITISQDAVLDRRTGESAMPANLIEMIDDRDLRDLVEFLAEQKSAPTPDVESLEVDGQ